MRFDLASLAPRLALARDQHNAMVADRERQILRLQHELLPLERLVAHRDLQLIRASAIGRGRYIDARRRKLTAAQRALTRTREALAQLQSPERKR